MGELLKRVLLVKWWKELGGEQNTSGSVLKHFLMLQVETSLHLGS